MFIKGSQVQVSHISMLEVLKCDGKDIVLSEFQRSIPALHHCAMTPKDYTGDLYVLHFCDC